MLSILESNNFELSEFQLCNGQFFDEGPQSYYNLSDDQSFTGLLNYREIEIPLVIHNNRSDNEVDNISNTTYHGDVLKEQLSKIIIPDLRINDNFDVSTNIEEVPRDSAYTSINSFTGNHLVLRDLDDPQCFSRESYLNHYSLAKESCLRDSCKSFRPIIGHNPNLHYDVNNFSTNCKSVDFRRNGHYSMDAKKIRGKSKNRIIKRILKRKPLLSSTKGHRLWEFIRDILHSSKYVNLVKWENEAEGVFRFIDSEGVAKLWGRRKNNIHMTYEKLSRAMRTYYASQILEPVPKNGRYPKKLVYKFGPRSYGVIQPQVDINYKKEMYKII